jgi:hypothetical protein
VSGNEFSNDEKSRNRREKSSFPMNLANKRAYTRQANGLKIRWALNGPCRFESGHRQR